MESLRAAGTAVELIETHISFVVLAGALAYKIKKAVNLGFLDFTTLALRQHFCAEELRLNRRLAPALYLDVIPITLGDGKPVFGGTGTVIDWAVKMRAFAQDGLWDRRVARGELTPAHIDAAAQRLCEFHRDAAVCGAGSSYGQPLQVREPMLQTLEALQALLADTADRDRLDTLRDWEAQAFKALRVPLSERLRDGHVRECHGDLHLGNVAQVDGEPTLFDCLEFDAGLRWTDVMSDVGFLAMDLHSHQRADLAHRFVNAYLERSGDYGGARVLRYHLVYRALVRAKVAALRTAQSVSAGARALANALVDAGQAVRHYLDVALNCSRTDGPVLMLTHGFSGSGKSTFSAHLLEAVGAIRIRSDVERKRLAGLPASAQTGSALRGGLYEADRTATTHERLRQAARCVLQGGFSVILDATFLQREQRALARSLAHELGIRFVIVDFPAQAATLHARIAARIRTGGDASEADLAVLDDQLRHDEPLSAAERAEVFELVEPQSLDADAIGAIGRRLRDWLELAPEIARVLRAPLDLAGPGPVTGRR